MAGDADMTTGPSRPLQPGDQAPSFALPAVNRDGQVGLDDYRGKAPVLVALFRGLHCPFCRRHVAQLGMTRDKLAREGVETLVIVNTRTERARQYFQYRPSRVLLAADPEVRTHQAFGLPKIGIVPDDTDPATLHWPQRATMAQFLAPRFNPNGELPEPKNVMEAGEMLNRKDGFEPTEVDQQIMAAHGSQVAGEFLIDARGMVRWSYVEGAGGPYELPNFPPSDDQILTAVQAMSR
jgi:peroxiredoxin